MEDCYLQWSTLWPRGCDECIAVEGGGQTAGIECSSVGAKAMRQEPRCYLCRRKGCGEHRSAHLAHVAVVEEQAEICGYSQGMVRAFLKMGAYGPVLVVVCIMHPQMGICSGRETLVADQFRVVHTSPIIAASGGECLCNRQPLLRAWTRELTCSGASCVENSAERQ